MLWNYLVHWRTGVRPPMNIIKGTWGFVKFVCCMLVLKGGLWRPHHAHICLQRVPFWLPLYKAMQLFICLWLLLYNLICVAGHSVSLKHSQKFPSVFGGHLTSPKILPEEYKEGYYNYSLRVRGILHLLRHTIPSTYRCKISPNS